MSVAVRGAGGNACFLDAHTTRPLPLLALGSQPAETKHPLSIHLTLTVPSTGGGPRSNPSISVEFLQRTGAVILHFAARRFHCRATAKRNHQARGCPLAGEPSKRTSPLCREAHYVVTALILHK